MCFTYAFIFMQILLIFIWKVLLEDSFWNWGSYWLCIFVSRPTRMNTVSLCTTVLRGIWKVINSVLRVLEPNIMEIIQLQYANKVVKYHYSHYGQSYEENKFLVWNFFYQIKLWVFYDTLHVFFFLINIQYIMIFRQPWWTCLSSGPLVLRDNQSFAWAVWKLFDSEGCHSKVLDWRYRK